MTRLYKVSEAAEQLNVSRNFVYKLIASGTLKWVRKHDTRPGAGDPEPDRQLLRAADGRLGRR